MVQHIEGRSGEANRGALVQFIGVELEVISPAEIEVSVVRSNLGVAWDIIGTSVEEIRSKSVFARGDGPWLASVSEDADAEIQQVLGIEHTVKTEMLALLPVRGTPFGIGFQLVLREPVDAAGVVAVVAPGIPGKAGEVLVEAAAEVDIESAAVLIAFGLNLTQLRDVCVGAYRIVRWKGRVDVDGPEEVDAAIHAAAD